MEFKYLPTRVARPRLHGHRTRAHNSEGTGSSPKPATTPKHAADFLEGHSTVSDIYFKGAFEEQSRCGALRVRDAEHNWRIMYRIDSDAVLVLEVYSKKSRTIPDEVIGRCKNRLRRYDTIAKASKKNSTGN